MTHLHSYPSVYAIGHKAIADIFSGDVLVEEKIDGSQISFCRINGEFLCRSKGKDIIPSAPEKMFAKAVQVAQSLPLTEGWVYRAEYLQSPKHNTLCYSRIPAGHMIVFDICTGIEQYLGPEQKLEECRRIGLECVPELYCGKVDSMEQFVNLLQTESCLGGCKIEGVVVKNYSLFTPDKKVAIGKYVSEEFKEKHGVEWKKSNPTRTDVVQLIINQYRTEARWRKAVQHLAEAGKLEHSPKDIGPLILETQSDTMKECEQEIKDELFRHLQQQIRRSIVHGLPEWYKEELAKSAFKQEQS